MLNWYMLHTFRTLELCLTEVSKCQLFLGILGERYGWVPPDLDNVPDTPEFSWIDTYRSGVSVTELEIQAATVAYDDALKEKAFFYLRDSSFEK